jgi:hypothetical protein
MIIYKKQKNYFYIGMGWKKILSDIRDKYNEYSENRIENERKRAEYEKTVNKLLDKFEIPDFDQFLLRFLNKKPEPEIETDEETNRERKINPGRREYLDFVWDHLNDNEINFQQLKDFALKKRIVTLSFFGEETDIEEEKREFNELINAIKSDFEPERITNEEHLQAQLTIFLKAKFPDRKISREVITKRGDKLDIVVDDKYVFELKVPADRTVLRNLGAQLEEYVEEHPNICAVIFESDGTNLSTIINDYADKYKRDYGIRTIILRGTKLNY